MSHDRASERTRLALPAAARMSRRTTAIERRPLASGAARATGPTMGRRSRCRRSVRGSVLCDFEALLFAHGERLRNDRKRALREFVELPVEHPEYGPYT